MISVTILEIEPDFPLCCRYREIDIRCQLESTLIVQTLPVADRPAHISRPGHFLARLPTRELGTMSRHEGVSCDSCMRSNFRGRRFKCLICYDYDLCSACFEQGASTPRHSASHPMQCILTRSDSELYFGGDNSLAEHQHSFTCPFCSKMGFTETTLQVRVSVRIVPTGVVTPLTITGTRF